MPQNQTIAFILQYIENNLSEEIDLIQLAKQHFISLSQLYRDFYSFTGHSLKEYIRKRRISNACEKIKSSDMPLALIAEECGCQTQQSFNKQFKSIVGMTPLEYKNNNTYYYFYPFRADGVSIAVKVGLEYIPATDISRYYDTTLEGIENKAVASLDGTEGRIFGRNGKQTKDRFCYELMIEKEGFASVSCFATCIANYTEVDINKCWNYLYNIWLSSSMFEQAEGGYFEEYLFKNGKPHKLKLYLPVRKRKTINHITIASEPESLFITSWARGENAERRAAEKVMEFMRKYHSSAIMETRRFYVCVHNDTYKCGVEFKGDITLLPDATTELLRIPSGQYAVLPDDCLGDITTGASKIEQWVINNSIPCADTPVFAIYETQNGRFDTGSINMKLYKYLNIGKNG